MCLRFNFVSSNHAYPFTTSAGKLINSYCQNSYPFFSFADFYFIFLHLFLFIQFDMNAMTKSIYVFKVSNMQYIKFNMFMKVELLM